MENLSFQYPAWYLGFCALLGLAYALFLYYKDDTFKSQHRFLPGILAFLRFLTVTLLSALLLSPLLKSLITEIRKPVVILAQDNSESVKGEMNEEELAAYQSSFENLRKKLGETYDLKQYAFGSEVREGINFTFDDKASNISELLKSLYDLYGNQNLGAVVLATDGIYNEGSNPIYAGTQLAAPIYTIALGDTTPQRDLLIKRVFHNKIAYLGDKFSIQVDIAANNCSGAKSVLRVSRMVDGKAQKIKDVPVDINKKDFFTTEEIILDADIAGVQRYIVSLNKIDGEVSSINNRKEIFLDILDARQKVLILANAPHPDVTAIKQSVAKNKNYQIETAYINSTNLNVAAYDFVILHQLPSRTNDAAAVLQTLTNKAIPRMYIVGLQSDFGKIGKVQPIVDIRANSNNSDDVQASVSSNFNLFTISDKLKNDLSNFAPLTSPFGEYVEDANAQVLLYQRIGKVETNKPLLAFGEQNGVKTGILTAEGIWKWRLFDFLQNENHDLFEELFSKTIQYLSVKEDKWKFRVSVNKNIFNENEKIILDAELYNESYELINDADASLIITNSEGKDFNFTFNKTPNAYTLNAGNFPVGNYKFKGTVNSNGKELIYNGQFSVQPVQLEIYETTADHGILKILSEKHGGNMVLPNDMTSIASLLEGKGEVKPIMYQTSKTRSVINLKWIFFILLVLLTLEWFFRRYFGGY